MTAGQSTSYTVTVSSSGGFTDPVSLSMAGLPAGTTTSWSANPVPGGTGTSTLAVATSTSTPVATSALKITGTSGALSHAATVSLVVTAPPTPDFSLALNPTSQSVRGGGSVGYTVTVNSVNGFGGSVSLSVTGLPAGSSGTFAPASVTPGAPSILTIRTASTPRGTFRFTVSGASSGLTRTTSGTLRVTKR